MNGLVGLVISKMSIHVRTLCNSVLGLKELVVVGI